MKDKGQLLQSLSRACHNVKHNEEEYDDVLYSVVEDILYHGLKCQQDQLGALLQRLSQQNNAQNLESSGDVVRSWVRNSINDGEICDALRRLTNEVAVFYHYHEEALLLDREATEEAVCHLQSLENNDINYVCNTVALNQWRDDQDKDDNNSNEEVAIGFNRRYSVGNKLSYEEESPLTLPESNTGFPESNTGFPESTTGSYCIDQDSLLDDMTPLTPINRLNSFLLSSDTSDMPSPSHNQVYHVRSSHSETKLSSASDLTNLPEEETLPEDTATNADTCERLKYFTQIPRELGLPKQQFSCVVCKCDIGNQGQEYKVCNYDRLYYCQGCFGNSSSVIPSRIFYNWDHRSYRVCSRSYEYLQQVQNQPNIDLSKINVSLYSHVPELNKVKDYRLMLLEIREYLVRCSNKGSQLYEQIRKKLGTHTYYWDAPHLYSLSDLNKVYSSQLVNYLKKLVQKCIHHVYCCIRCTDFGHICEFCKNPKIIFAFELQTTEQCAKCRAVFHKVCKRTSDCPRCIRKETFHLRKRENEN